jgi:hypothetical protein
MPDNFACQGEMFKGKNTAKTLSFGGRGGAGVGVKLPDFPRADGAKRRARVLIPPGYLHPGKRKH